MTSSAVEAMVLIPSSNADVSLNAQPVVVPAKFYCQNIEMLDTARNELP